MLDFYTWKTPNGRKVSILLEELGLRYRVHPVDLSRGDQARADFLAINPNGKIPVLVDSQGPGGVRVSLAESGAILVYLAERAETPLWPADPVARAGTLQWLMFQMSAIGPMMGQAFHFRHHAPEEAAYGRRRFDGEVRRLFGVLNDRLSDSDYLAGLDYTLADVATYPWVSAHETLGIDLDDLPALARWHDEISERPAVRRGMKVPV